MADTISTYALVQKAAQSHPNRLAIVTPTSRITFAQLEQISSQIAQVMRRRGVVPGDIIAVNLPAAWRCIMSVAVSHEAAVTVPLSPSLLSNNQLGIKWLAVDKAIAGVPIEQQFVIDKQMMNRLKSVVVTAAPRAYESPDSLCRIAMSSGTTGVAKAIPLSVQHSHDRALESVNRWSTDGPFMSFMIPKNGAGCHAWHASLVRQEKYLVPTDAVNNVRLLAAHGVEAVMGSPSHLSVFARALTISGVRLPQLRVIQSGGSRLTPALVSELRDLTGVEVGNAYSSTELGTVAYRMGHSEDPSYMGTLAGHAETQIVDPVTDELLPDGEYGVIRLRRPDMVSGYLNNPDATAAHFRNGWFYPGDVATIVDNELFLGARESELINASGLKVDPNIVDEAVIAQPDIVDAATFAYVDGLGLDNVAVAFVLKPDGDADAVWAAVSQSLGNRAPTHTFPVESIPRNEWGKVVRRELSERFSVQPKT
ncbi:MAG: acyl--CoA ligase [Microbacteriaceae bacterium]|nr:acyl--CoA ligase [Microbacteriaceae bacterium]